MSKEVNNENKKEKKCVECTGTIKQHD